MDPEDGKGVHSEDDQRGVRGPVTVLFVAVVVSVDHLVVVMIVDIVVEFYKKLFFNY